MSSFQNLCKSTAILLYRYEENIKKLLNRSFLSPHILCLLIPNLMRVLLQKSTFIKIHFPCTYPNPLGLKTKDEPKTNLG